MPADILLAVRFVVHKNGGHIYADCTVQNKRTIYFSIDSAFIKTVFSTTQGHIFSQR